MDNRIRELEMLKEAMDAHEYTETMPLEGDFGTGEKVRARRSTRRMRAKKGSSVRDPQPRCLFCFGFAQYVV
jgi:hypothetical protein